MEISNEELLKAVEESINEIDSLLPNKLDGKTLSKTSKLPYKLASINYSFAHRFNAIAETALQLFNREQYLPSAILIRSLMETSSMLFLVETKIEKYLSNFDSEKPDDFLMKVLVGGRLNSDDYHSYNSLTAIDKVANKKHDQFRKMYNQLSEFTHPSWAGSAGYFSKVESEGSKVFTESASIENPLFILFPFPISTTVLIDSFSAIQELMPKFIKTCENSCP